MIGECGGKNYHFVHPTADVTSVVNGTIRSSFEYCGQKCSACSRIYVPESLWPKVILFYIFVLFSFELLFIYVQIKEGLLELRNQLKIGDVAEFDSFSSAVIDDKAFKRITGYIEHAKNSPNLEIIGGGQYDDR